MSLLPALVVCAFLAMHVLAATVLPTALWGANHLRFLSPTMQGLWIVAAIALFVLSSRQRVANVSDRAWNALFSMGRLSGALLLALVLALLLTLRSRNIFAGD